jgi:glyoxylase-like metal-dependent hydrolase (beta-lactamase superfamily II)
MNSIEVKYLRVGHCRHLECIAARGGDFKMIDFPALCGLIRHPQWGWILFDTGYSEHFYHATEHLPQSLYRIALPITLSENEKLLVQLHAMGISAEDINLVIISHYHGDHIAGLKDFPNARFIASRKDTNAIQQLVNKPWRATLQGILPGLLPTDYFKRLSYADDYKIKALPKWMQPFSEGFDILGDASLLLITLAGHSQDMLGLLITNAAGRPVFMAADACWSLNACKEGRLPAALARIATDNSRKYQSTFISLGELARREPSLAILPSHCTHSWEQFNHD